MPRKQEVTLARNVKNKNLIVLAATSKQRFVIAKRQCEHSRGLCMKPANLGTSHQIPEDNSTIISSSR
jgi:hypothetical protein